MFGWKKALTNDYIKAVAAKLRLVARYPSTPGRAESGRRRAGIILSNESVHDTNDASVATISFGIVEEANCPKTRCQANLSSIASAPMRCPTLRDLPPAPPGRTGWPWTVESPQLPDTMPTGRPWPRISIVTPSYNQGQFIEETIRSVLLQGYPNLEYIVMDGGSKDRTLEILRKYQHAIGFWISAPDKGQAEAINKGFARASGEIWAGLNSDDVYELRVFSRVAELFQQLSDVDVLSGRCRLWDGGGGGNLRDPSPLRTLEDFLKLKTNWTSGRLIVPPEAFFRPDAFNAANGVREEFHFCFDACLWMDMAKAGPSSIA